MKVDNIININEKTQNFDGLHIFVAKLKAFFFTFLEIHKRDDIKPYKLLYEQSDNCD